MNEKMIRDAWARIRTIDNTIPDDVLDFMKDAAIEKIKRFNDNAHVNGINLETLKLRIEQSDKLTP
jgi:hypothetical protein